jgi:hypothetical protein
MDQLVRRDVESEGGAWLRGARVSPFVARELCMSRGKQLRIKLLSCIYFHDLSGFMEAKFEYSHASHSPFPHIVQTPHTNYYRQSPQVNCGLQFHRYNVHAQLEVNYASLGEPYNLK